MRLLLKKKQSDFIVGIVIFIALIILVAGVLWLKEMSFTRQMVTYTALFPNIGGLQKGDPVSANGVKKGVVSQIYLRKSEVAVEFKIDAEVLFTDSSRVTVKNVGLMGERKIEISLSPQGSKHLPDTEEKQIFIKGFFDSGIAEAIGMLGDLMHDASGLLDTVEYIIGETIGDDEFITFFDNAVDRLDTITIMVDSLLAHNDQKINRIVQDVKVTTGNLRGIVQENRKPLSNIVTNAEDLTIDAKELVTELDTIINSVEHVISKIDTGNGTVGQLINNDQLIGELKQTLTNLDILLANAEEQGIKLRVKLGFGKNKKR